MYKYKLSKTQKDILKSEKIYTVDFERFLGSRDMFSVPADELGYMNNSIFNRILNCYFHTTKIQDYLFKCGYDLQVHHCYRHPKTVERLMKQGLKPSKTSQHNVASAVDCMVWKRELNAQEGNMNIITTHTDLNKVGKIVWDNRSTFNVRQVIVYKNFIHLGFNSVGSDRLPTLLFKPFYI